MKEIVEGKSEMKANMRGEVRCAFFPAQVHTTANTFKVDIYVVSDLSFYDMLLGREGKMGR